MCGLFHSPFVPPSLSAHKCGTPGRQPPPPGICQLLLAGQLQPCLPRATICRLDGSTSHSLAHPSPPATALPRLLSAQLRVSAPPSSLDECVFFNSLIVGLPYSLIFCQFWLFFVLKLWLTFFWLCKEAQCLPTTPSWLEVLKCPSLSLVAFVILKSLLPDISMATPALLWMLFARRIIFHFESNFVFEA